ncbi:DUF2922 domain-containing protein [Lactobacillus taiwanensis]|uniref:DUF2922 domain-containing protein n=1 Tax=Lactobacillus taiwanensis TaxID=508451 RepID=UPI000B99AA04|nr:DUF2922 domain-containing protein [Lactobacillus taiwanensis]OYR96272.1 hypothetical protein CBF51_06055 [Lactobacillus taiwanensis]OYS01344.1 hypothetical protein CBF61_05565 [Lactobacillus taiwanensis]OYS14023.1 hypothetical protein CBF69_08010 [Lactobacillus taiwanensis]OYS19582.1 hypothetical protein CBF49_03855 [Lactobacillus taiwanensis]OYS20606.1 hypothetical protein CBF56_00770 [Lactobacillus taiwanensis]
MKKVLKLHFKNAKDKTKMITIADPKEGLSKDVVQASMDQIVAAKAFSKEEVALYESVDSAKYYTTQSDNIFDTDAE